MRIYRDVATDANGKMALMVMVFAFITLCITRDMSALKHDDEKHDDAEMKPGTDADDEIVPDPPPKWAMTTLLCVTLQADWRSRVRTGSWPVSVIQSIRASHVTIGRDARRHRHAP